MLVSASRIGRYLQEVLDVLVLEDLLDPCRAKVDAGLEPVAAIRDQLDGLAFCHLLGSCEQAAQGILHHRVQAAVMPGSEGLRLGEQILVEPERSAMRRDARAYEMCN
jgi:hypothetical protein